MPPQLPANARAIEVHSRPPERTVFGAPPLFPYRLAGPTFGKAEIRVTRFRTVERVQFIPRDEAIRRSRSYIKTSILDLVGSVLTLGHRNNENLLLLNGGLLDFEVQRGFTSISQNVCQRFFDVLARDTRYLTFVVNSHKTRTAPLVGEDYGRDSNFVLICCDLNLEFN
jgi:hypothetical protein